MSEHIDPVKLDRLAEVAVRTGVNLQPGQDLVITAPMAALELVRRITVHAYKAGAGIVMPFFSDDEITLARYENAPDESFDHAPEWFYEGLAAAYKGGAARMAITGDDPMLLAEQDPSKVARLSKATSIAAKPAMNPIVGFEVNWNIVAYPGAAWASRVFPDLPVDEAQSKLMDAIYAASRLDGDDPLDKTGHISPNRSFQMSMMTTNAPWRAPFLRLARLFHLSGKVTDHGTQNPPRDPRNLPAINDHLARDIGLSPADLERQRLVLPSQSTHHPGL